MGKVATTIIDEDFLNRFKEVVGDSFDDIIDKYIHSSEQLMETLAQACDAGNLRAVAHAAHSIKSPSHQIGALAFKDTLAAMEEDAFAEKNERLGLLLNEAKAQFVSVKEALSDMASGT